MLPKITMTILMLLGVSGVVIKEGNVGNENNRSNGCPPESRLLEVGEFHGDEVKAQTGEKWLGLHISDGESMLLNYQLTVEAVHDQIVDEPDQPEQKTGKKVSVDLPLKPIFLLDADWISAGPVQTVFKGNYEKNLAGGSPITLNLADASYELKVISTEEGDKCSNAALPKNAMLVLASGGYTQVLYSLEECGNDPGWFLLWAGDLDGDGHLDLYLSVNQHYNVSEKKLFLSSAAGKKRLVEEVAEFITSGC